MAGLPEAFEQRMRGMLGEEYQAFEAALFAQRAQGLRVSEIRLPKRFADASEVGVYLAQLMGWNLTPVAWTREGFAYGAKDRPGKHPLHEAGAYYIQEPSAMAVVSLLDPKPGERVLDLCAAPGGKSTHAASRLNGKGLLIANEIHPARAKILSQNVERMGAKNVVVTNETPARLSKQFPEFFDAMIVDAPCSGEGMFRKDEEAIGHWSPENVRLCAERQDEILEEAAKMLRSGGRMVYSTCTFAPEEDEGAIARFLNRHADFSLKTVTLCDGMDSARPEWAWDIDGAPLQDLTDEAKTSISRAVRIFPHHGQGEGHFMALLVRDGEDADVKREAPVKERLPKNWKALLADYESFCKEQLKDSPEDPDGRWELFGDQLYRVPAGVGDLAGLKVLRPGLHLGTFKKNRMEPAHALALSLRPEEANFTLRLDPQGEEVARFLRGETLDASLNEELSGKKGWVLVCAGEWSLGWAKLGGGILKNHYPKGLRRG